VFTYFSLKSPFTSEEEMMLLQFTSGLKRKVIQKHEKPGADRFLFISVSWDKKLIDKLDEYGTPIGKQPITDRANITRFLQILNQKPDNHTYLMIDIFFADFINDGSRDDHELAVELKKTRNLLIPYHLTESGEPDYPIFQTSLGLADYEPTVDGQLVKFNIIRDGKYKTMPLLMYEQVSGSTYKAGMILDKLGDTPVMNAFILDHRIFEEDLRGTPSAYQKYYLNELLTLPPEAIHDFTKDRIIVLEGWFLKWLPLPAYMKELIESFASYLLYFTVLSILSYLLFNFHLTILLISFYMQVLEWVLKNFLSKLTWVTNQRKIA
jgi:hypothetical protein